MLKAILLLLLSSIVSKIIGNEIRYPLKKQNVLSKRYAQNSSENSNVYTIEFKIGSKEKKISALMDTSSSDFWVLGDNACNSYLSS